VSMAQDYPTLTAAPMPADPDPDREASTQDQQASSHQPCDTCGAPLDERQRYCLACGTRRKHADDPAARFLAAATRRRRIAPAVPGAAGGGRRSAPLAIAAAVAAIPIALGVGVLVGRSSGGGDGKLIAALRAEKAPVIQYSGSAAGGTAAAAASAPKAAVPVSTFALSKGYAVQLGTLPSGTSAASAKSTLQADKGKGAPGAALLSQSTYTVTPSPPSGAYLVYAGSYSTKAAAEKALGRFKHHFSGAKVVEIQSAASASTGGGKVLNKTVYGSAHQVTGFKPTAQSLKQGAQVAQQDSHDTGKEASGAGLPDVVSVP
jgi:hypothetical protein